MAGIKFLLNNRNYSSIIPINGIVEHLRISTPTGEAQTELELIRDAAARIIEDRTNYILGTADLEVYLDCWHSLVRIPYGPNFSVTYIEYASADGQTVRLSNDSYSVDSIDSPAQISFYDYPALEDRGFNLVKIVATVGAGSAASDIPEPLHAAVKILCGHLYENRQEVITGTIATQIPQGVDSLINPYRSL